ncbi:hypothetical protein A3A74_03210 [Candidatus Roizmanbacteria bacterium RIFCSPLOWO2_01_FULL_35_13]|uniref:Glycoside hydrolase family 5 domain-containing protein n=1 Tax=Candidatus Roizmanbacteria bacterium RIFCSPLOWO2_01_FULL_35_13 TaxID=1802055 RepID=A0A1F7IHU3_9BACT|nr:MAG: hypothetical protein A3A74_03210 [Candidatus Roizmanbacteria bacterium RIFCSPLOWO2_01_FULL_35_13]
MPINARERFFQVQSIDTMKYSRDLAREKIKDSTFDQTIEIQIKNIAGTGATHVSLGTPYEEEFMPYLKRWVVIARKYKLNVWFRGNLAGWENWFDYPKINRNLHTLKIKEFILNHPDLFDDGDVFSSCPECENGGPGDPRKTGDVDGFRNFIVNEYKTVKEAFKSLEKNVTANYYSMNGDVARLIMDKDTTAKLDGTVTVDHYVSTPEKLAKDIKNYAKESGGKIVLGEFGAPIPDIHGDLNQEEQAGWIDSALRKIVNTKEVIAINYWTNNASSTELWNDNNSPRLAVSNIEKYYNPVNVMGTIKDEKGNSVKEVTVKGRERTIVVTDGVYAIPVLDKESLTFSKLGYVSVNIGVKAENVKDIVKDIVLVKSYPRIFYSIYMKILNFFLGLLR